MTMVRGTAKGVHDYGNGVRLRGYIAMIRGTAKGVHNLTMVWGAAMRLCYILQYPMYTVVSTVGSLLLVVGESIHKCIYISVRLDIDVLLLFFSYAYRAAGNDFPQCCWQ